MGDQGQTLGMTHTKDGLDQELLLSGADSAPKGTYSTHSAVQACCMSGFRDASMSHTD